MIPTDPAEREAMAGEYVLGTLDAASVQAFERAMERDAALRDAVARWEAQFAPLLALAAPEAPPPDVWSRIERTLGRGIMPKPSAAPRVWWDMIWRGWALGATAAAAAFGALLLTRPAPEAPGMMTVLLTQRDQPAWIVEADRGGALRLASLNAQPIPSDRVMQLWALPQGATAPTSLGLIPPEGRLTVTPASIRPEPGMLIEISLEPPGGSPTGRPTGPILFIGRLSAARST